MPDYTFYKTVNILVAKYKGAIELEDALKHYKKLENTLDYPRQLNVIIDASEANFDFEPEKHHDISSALKQTIQNYESLKEAIIVPKSYETAVALLFKDITKFDNYNFRVFSTREAAQDWLIS